MAVLRVADSSALDSVLMGPIFLNGVEKACDHCVMLFSISPHNLGKSSDEL